MQRTFNFTGRSKITQEHISIWLSDENGILKAKWQINDEVDSLLKGAEEADVILEATHRNLYFRTILGKVAEYQKTGECSLEAFPLDFHPMFRLKAVDNSTDTGRILSASVLIRPIRDENDEPLKTGFLSVTFTDKIGEKTWEIDWGSNAKDPSGLRLNSKLTQGFSPVDKNPFIRAFVFPAVVREILFGLFTRLESREEVESCEMAEKWLKFMEYLLSETVPDDLWNDALNAADWVETAVKEFSNRKWQGAEESLLDLVVAAAEGEEA